MQQFDQLTQLLHLHGGLSSCDHHSLSPDPACQIGKGYVEGRFPVRVAALTGEIASRQSDKGGRPSHCRALALYGLKYLYQTHQKIDASLLEDKSCS